MNCNVKSVIVGPRSYVIGISEGLRTVYGHVKIIKSSTIGTGTAAVFWCVDSRQTKRNVTKICFTSPGSHGGRSARVVVLVIDLYFSCHFAPIELSTPFSNHWLGNTSESVSTMIEYFAT